MKKCPKALAFTRFDNWKKDNIGITVKVLILYQLFTIINRAWTKDSAVMIINIVSNVFDN